MNVTQAIKDYVLRIVTEVGGMKALFLDEETVGIVSMVLSQSQILEKEVFLTRRLDQVSQMGKKSDHQHLKAVFFVRPTDANVNAISAMIVNPEFSEFYLYFSNALPKDRLRDIAAVDEHEVVRSVQEFYGDYYAVNPDLFTLNVESVRTLYNEPIVSDNLRKLNRIRDGILSVLLSLRAKPYIRYQGSSSLAKRIANEVAKGLDLFGDVLNGLRLDEDTVMLVFDRREDPVTPLLAQWTYQAMVHEIIGIENNTVDLSASLNSSGRKVPDEEAKFVLSSAQDESFRKLMFLNYGDLAVSVKEMVEEYQRHNDEHKKIESIADMQNFIDNYGKFRSEAGAVARHVTVVGELNSAIDKRELMKVSALEQSLACEQDHASAVDQVRELVKDPKVSFDDKLKLVMLYSLRYEKAKNETPTFKALLRNAATTPAEEQKVKYVDEILQFCGTAARSKNGDVFSNKDLIAKAGNFLSNGLGGTKNIFTQHQPLLSKILDRLGKGRLTDEDFPYVESPGKRLAPKEIFVFIIGGVTFEEAAYIANLNATNPGARIIIGGNTILNSGKWLEEIGLGVKSGSGDAVLRDEDHKDDYV
eukprot:TRINITY_DN2534_c0_g1_i1.p1 TRINITY_DN2534_c0_g1~~TRINITY_DN2534_c0_g1_i1.p1  ORF type:complete len:588 (+),score=191.58 TRINITY_DN2534_c0_g1_i1:697-2460(+)